MREHVEKTIADLTTKAVELLQLRDRLMAYYGITAEQVEDEPAKAEPCPVKPVKVKQSRVKPAKPARKPGTRMSGTEALARGAYHATNIMQHSECAKRRGLCKSQTEARAALAEWIERPTADVTDLNELVLELLCLASPMREEDWTDLVRHAGVDQLECRKAAEAEVK